MNTTTKVCEREGCDNSFPRGSYHKKFCSVRCKKLTWAGNKKCIVCGTPLGTGSKNRNPTNRCARHPAIKWTEDRIISAMRSFASEFGRSPSAADWSPANALRKGQPLRAARFYERKGEWPSTSTVIAVFGAWNDAIRQAGLKTSPTGRPRRNT